jgi:hypothetical protein
VRYRDTNKYHESDFGRQYDAILTLAKLQYYGIKESQIVYEQSKTSLEHLGGKHNFWNMQDSFGILNEIVRSENIFVFRKDLEGTLQHPQTRQKPLKDLEKITELILGDDVQEEFCEMAAFGKSCIENRN